MSTRVGLKISEWIYILKYRAVSMLCLLNESIITVRFLIPVNFWRQENRDAVQNMRRQVFTFTSGEAGMSCLLHFVIHDAVTWSGISLETAMDIKQRPRIKSYTNLNPRVLKLKNKQHSQISALFSSQILRSTLPVEYLNAVIPLGSYAQGNQSVFDVCT